MRSSGTSIPKGSRPSRARLARPHRWCVVIGILLAIASSMVHAASPAHAAGMRQKQWQLDAWKIEEVWKVARGAGIVVAVVDTGIDATHPDLVGRILPSLNDEPGDHQGHGTSMAGLIAATGGPNGTGVFGVAPEARILPYHVKAGPSGDVTKLDDPSIAQGIRAAADSPAHIINLSLGGPADTTPTREAVAYALAKGKLVIASGGNTPPAIDYVTQYPAAYPGVLAVSAVDREGKRASNSVRGPWISLSAPGADISRACPTNRYCVGNGSSDAAALTSGIAALVWSIHPDWTANQVIRRLLDTANRPTDTWPSDTFGYGSASPHKAVAATDTPAPADLNPLAGVRGDKPTFTPSAPPTTAPATAPTTVSPTAPAPPTPVAPVSASPASPAFAFHGDSDNNDALVWVLAFLAGATVLTATALLARRHTRRCPADNRHGNANPTDRI